MLFSDILELASIRIEEDDLSQEIEVETLRRVFCDKQSIGQSEFFNGGQTGIKPAYKFIIRLLDYQEETKLMYKNKTYSIYRTYEKGENIELYCEVRAGG
ncbi:MULTISPECIES: hypothetical protein [Bacillus]|uniref:hypothetical protein n=1 Tax=Bacillus TaxID=1386 RepID=UPI0003187870|nr:MULTISPECIES: hypothetical protein [Bacillus]